MRAPVKLFRKIFPTLLCTIPSTSLYLTFDDGPSQFTTEAILELLKQFDIRATFFVLGVNVRRYPALLERIAKHQHTIGNHSYMHTSFLFKQKSLVTEEIESTNRLIENIVGYKPKYFRPPYGHITISLLQMVRSLGMETVLWSFDPKDYKRTPKTLTKIKLHKIKKGDIILCHDNLSQQVALPLVRTIIDYANQNSLQFLPL
ncbi:MAG: polysaccharide deacetylase family protein [Bacteroidetes bacterium]|nr:polysaccharide deacetylase family protein [Bacteroidota bacterium]